MKRFSRNLTHWSVMFLILSACRDPAPTETKGTQAAAPGASELPVESIVHVPVGTAQLGSRPADPGRNPRLEPLPYEENLGPFRIDRRARLGADGKPLIFSSPAQAAARCAEEGGRLCTEVEWERACRADLGLEVLGIPEWTSSKTGRKTPQPDLTVLRGLADTSASSAACARRRAAGPEEGASARCCYGAPNAPKLREPTEAPERPFAIEPLSREDLRRYLNADPSTRPLAASAEFFPDDSVSTVLERGPGDSKGFELTNRPVRWQPDLGVDFLVLTGRAESKTAFVVVFHANTDPPILAGSFLMKNEKGPVALAYAQSIRPRIHFSTCWGCPGETGKALFREPEAVVMLQP